MQQVLAALQYENHLVTALQFGNFAFGCTPAFDARGRRSVRCLFCTPLVRMHCS